MFRDDSLLPFHVQPGVTVRVADEEDTQGAVLVGARAFNQNTEHAYHAGSTLVAVGDDGRVGAALDMVVQPMWWGTAQVPGAAVTWVATDPAFQGKGYAGALMSGAVHHFREIGAAGSCLWPFSFAYYRKTGWELTCPDMRIHLWAAMADRLGNVPGTVRPYTPADRDAIAALYTAQAHTTNGAGVRDSAFWDSLEARTQIFSRCLVYEDGGTLQGYAHYQTSRQPFSDSIVTTIRELVVSHPASAIALLQAAVHLPRTTEIAITVARDSFLLDLLPERVKLEGLQRCQFRVIDVKRALESLVVPSDLRGTISFEVIDHVVSADSPIAVTANIEGGRDRKSVV